MRKNQILIFYKNLDFLCWHRMNYSFKGLVQNLLTMARYFEMAAFIFWRSMVKWIPKILFVSHPCESKRSFCVTVWPPEASFLFYRVFTTKIGKKFSIFVEITVYTVICRRTKKSCHFVSLCERSDFSKMVRWNQIIFIVSFSCESKPSFRFTVLQLKVSFSFYMVFTTKYCQ